MIDVIIPFYKNINDLKKTLCSIGLQKIKDKINVYIIDNSNNKSLKDVVDIFKDDFDITVYKTNKKISSGLSKNKGLEISKGKYIMFIDSGDMFYNPFSVNELYNVINNNKKLDVVYGKYVEVDNNKQTRKTYDDTNTYSKMYNREYLNKNNIYFIDDECFSDYVFNSEVILNSECNKDYFDSYIMMHFDNEEFVNNEYKCVNNYIESMSYLIKKMENKGYDKDNIVSVIVDSTVYLYLLYSYNIDDKNVNKIINNSTYIYGMYVKYRDYFTYNYIYELISSLDSGGNLPILFGEFIRLYE